MLRDQTDERLREMYVEEDYYHYLRSEEFQRSIFRPVAALLNSLQLRCLDVGCGEGQLSEFIKVPYTGFDASPDAITIARKRYPDRRFRIGRLDEYRDEADYGTIVLSNVLWCLIRKESYTDVLDHYRESFKAEFIVIIDLARLDTTAIDRQFQKIIHLDVDVGHPSLSKRLNQRKIMVYQCK